MADALKTKSVLGRKVQFAFGSAILALLLVGGFSYRSIVVSSESDRRVEHTREVLDNLQQLVFAVTRIEWSVRGYILTGEESYLDAYRASKLSAEQREANVRRLTVDNPEQQRRIPALEGLVAQRSQFAEMVSGLRRVKGLEAASDVIRGGQGPRITDKIHAVALQLQDEELRLLSIRHADAAQRLDQTKSILILGTILGLLITGIAGWIVQRDSSKRELAEKALRNSEQQHRALIQGVQEYGIVMLGPLGEFLSWNPGAERMTGCTYEEIAGQNFSRFFPEDDIKRGRPEEILRIAAAGGLHEEQGLRMRKDGTRFQVRATFTAMRDLAGNLSGFSVISRDLTDSTGWGAKYRGLLEAAPDAMLVLNQGGEIVLLNVQAEKQFGYRGDELVGQMMKNIIPEGFAERLIADGTRTAAETLAQQIGTGIELMGRRKDGGEFPIEIMLSPLASPEGTLVTVAIRDISVRKDMETQNAQLHAKLRQAEKMEAIGTLAGGVAHELNNLLQPIIMMTELVLTELPEGGRHANHLFCVVDAGNKAAEIVQRILAFGRIDEVAHDVLDVTSVMREAIAFIRTTLPSSIRLHLKINDFVGTVRGDKTQLTQVLINLAVNARDAIGSEVGAMWISLSRWNAEDDASAPEVGKLPRGAYAMLTVRDTGSGMDDATARRIFEPFFTTKAVGKGTGLGLSITHGIITSHGGAMRVDRAPGGGTIFSIYLPIEENKAVFALAS